MKMILEEMEVEQAITHYINTKYFTLKGKHLEIDFQVGRNPQNVTANLNIVDDAATTTPPEVPATETAEDTPFNDEQSKLPFSD